MSVSGSGKMIDPETCKLEKVQKLVAKHILTVHVVRPKDKKVLRSPVYQIWNILYDQNNKRFPHFYVCRKCHHWEKVVLTSEGNSKLTRHACYEAYIAQTKAKKAQNKAKEASPSDDECINSNDEEDFQKTADEDESDEDSENNDSDLDAAGPSTKRQPTNSSKMTPQQFTLLARTFSQFSEICMKPEFIGFTPFKPTDISAILPKNWERDEW